MTLIASGLMIIKDFSLPSPDTLLFLAIAGTCSGFGVMFLGMAYSKAATATVAPFEYIRMAWGVFIWSVYLQ